MKLPIITVVFDRRNRSSEKKKGTIEIRVTIKRQSSYIATGVRILPSEWDPESYVKTSNPRYHLYRTAITSKINLINSQIALLSSRGEEISIEGILSGAEKAKYQGSFIDFIEASVESRNDICNGTMRNHRKLVSALKKFNRIKTFSDLSPNSIRLFDQWLHKKKIKQSTVHSYHKMLKVYVRLALEKELIDKNPYLGIRINSGTSDKVKFLTEEEFLKFTTAKILPVLEKIRDMFLFQVYTGLSYSDMARFNKNDVVERNGRYILTAQRQKTKKDYYIVLTSRAMDILKKYDWELPKMSLEQYNCRLKMIALEAGIEKNISSHMARHTFAVNAINTGIPIAVVSRMLGHSNINTTQIYAKVINPTIDNAFDQLEKVSL